MATILNNLEHIMRPLKYVMSQNVRRFYLVSQGLIQQSMIIAYFQWQYLKYRAGNKLFGL